MTKSQYVANFHAKEKLIKGEQVYLDISYFLLYWVKVLKWHSETNVKVRMNWGYFQKLLLHLHVFVKFCSFKTHSNSIL